MASTSNYNPAVCLTSLLTNALTSMAFRLNHRWIKAWMSNDILQFYVCTCTYSSISHGSSQNYFLLPMHKVMQLLDNESCANLLTDVFKEKPSAMIFYKSLFSVVSGQTIYAPH